MWTSAFVFSVCLSVAAASEFELLDYNGWKPVSSDLVLNQIQRGVTHAPQFTKVDDVQIINNDLIKIITEHNEFTEDDYKEEITDGHKNKCSSGDPATCMDGNFRIEKNPQFEHNFLPNKFLPFENQKMKTETPVRRSKKLDEKRPFHSNKILHEESNTITTFKNKLQKIDNDIHSYEVTENVNEVVKQESVLKKRGYEYKPPAKQNFTNSLIKFLSNYNIKDSDNLQNYALSRRAKAYSPVTENAPHNPLHFQLPIRYNSLNHLPVDPLLAVFLSNYGYYLQGQYGIQNNYNNLYGNLAFNNIHNNRPFGFYKLFSDTDSSQ